MFTDQGQKDYPGQCGHLPRLLAKEDRIAIAMCHNDHWFAGIAIQNVRKLYVFDSDKYFKKEDREVCVGGWCTWLRELWGGLQVTAVNRSLRGI